MAGDINKAASRMSYWCTQANLGYDQSNRWDIRDGGECDCSSLVIHALREAGFDTGDASYTGDLSANLTSHGWVRLSPVLSQLRKGDIILKDQHHVCMVVSGTGTSAKIAEANIDENGRIYGGRAGDQTGNETRVIGVYEYRGGWDCILRYGGAGAKNIVTIDGVWGYQTMSAAQRWLGTPVDGTISGQPNEYRSYFPNVNCIQYTNTSAGSLWVKSLQRKLGGLTVDGLFGNYTRKAFQKWLDVYPDGYIGRVTVMAFQRKLNL